MKTLADIVSERPYPDYADWWPMGETFLRFMSSAIVRTWRSLRPRTPTLDQVDEYVTQYIDIVYKQQATPRLAHSFASGKRIASIRSGEFDALSYAFFRSAYEWITSSEKFLNAPPALARHAFATRVGERFYEQLHQHLDLKLPGQLNEEEEFSQLKSAIQEIGNFLLAEGYLRDHFAFRFDVEVESIEPPLSQQESDFIRRLKDNNLAYALYEMGYPAILPSAVYLYHTQGEAQHHSSRTFEELFAQIGYHAAETNDFDPSSYPSERVVELWEIRPRP